MKIFDIRRIFVKSGERVVVAQIGKVGNVWWRSARLDLILLMRDIYINSNLTRLPKFTSSIRSPEFKDILLWNISQMVTKTIPISTRIVIWAMRWNGTSCSVFSIWKSLRVLQKTRIKIVARAIYTYDFFLSHTLFCMLSSCHARVSEWIHSSLLR